MSDSGAASTADPLRAHLERSLSGAYRVERELGGGGMARVFLAEELALGREVVVKVLSAEVAQAFSAERFAREVKLSARLQHPGIVPVLTAGTAGGLPYYTMPFIQGESLRARLDQLAQGERLSGKEAMGVLRDVARALAYAHDFGVVHRDIKPNNVLLAYDAAVVADFGIAKAIAAAQLGDGPEGATGTLTTVGTALGTPAYMAPEQAAGDPGVDHRADIYAWGVVAYEVLAGAHPFAGRRSIQALVTAHLVEQARPLDEMSPHLPRDVTMLVMRCLEKDPANRPTSAREIVETLSVGVGADRETPSEPLPLGTRAKASVAASARRRRRPVVVGLSLALLVTAGGGIVYALRGASTRAAGSPTMTGARRGAASPAYDAYLRGRVRVSSENPEDNAAAIVALTQAIARDSSFAPAWAELSRAYSIRAFYIAPDSEKKQLREDAEIAVERALSLDADLAEAHFARGLMLWTPVRRFPHEQAAQAYRQALALDPRLDEVRHQLALVEMHVGLLEEARAELDLALAINPANTLARFRLGVVALYLGQYERAHGVFTSTPLERNPTLWAFQTATALFRLGREREATELIDEFLRDYPKDEGGVGHSVRAMMHAKAGRQRNAEEAIATAIKLGRNFGHFHHTAYNVASAYALLGRHDEAIRFLEDAANNGFPCYPLFARDAQLDALRTDPRFIALMARLERDWKERKLKFFSNS